MDRVVVLDRPVVLFGARGSEAVLCVKPREPPRALQEALKAALEAKSRDPDRDPDVAAREREAAARRQRQLRERNVRERELRRRTRLAAVGSQRRPHTHGRQGPADARADQDGGDNGGGEDQEDDRLERLGGAIVALHPHAGLNSVHIHMDDGTDPLPESVHAASAPAALGSSVVAASDSGPSGAAAAAHPVVPLLPLGKANRAAGSGGTPSPALQKLEPVGGGGDGGGGCGNQSPQSGDGAPDDNREGEEGTKHRGAITDQGEDADATLVSTSAATPEFLPFEDARAFARGLHLPECNLQVGGVTM